MEKAYLEITFEEDIQTAINLMELQRWKEVHTHRNFITGIIIYFER